MHYTLDHALEQLEKVRIEASLFATEMIQRIGEIKSQGPGDVGTQSIGEVFTSLICEQEQRIGS